MKPSEKFKICGHCDGRVPMEVVICPYCASNLSGSDSSKPLSSQKTTPSSENLASLYNPPYASQRSMPTSAMDEKKKPSDPVIRSEVKTATIEKSEIQTSEKSEILPISLLVIGSNLLTIGILQLLFSDNGLLQLEWNTGLWYVYSLASIPMLWLGIKSLRKAN